MALNLVSGPRQEPVTVEEARNHLRVDITTDDDLILGLVQAAREMAEQILRRALISQTWDYKQDGWPAGDFIEIPLPPLQSITSITYQLYSDGSVSTLASSKYFAVTSTVPGRVALKPGYTWPGDSLYPYQAVATRFVAGYGDSPSDVPGPIRSAIKLLIGHLYENREGVFTGRGAPNLLPYGVGELLQPYRVFGW